MGLDAFDIAPDNKGGRPTKEEQEEKKREQREIEYDVEKNPHHHNCGEEYWQEAFDKFVDGDEMTFEELEDLCRYSMLLGRSVLQELFIHDIYDGREQFDVSFPDPEKRGYDSDTESSRFSSSSGLGALVDRNKNSGTASKKNSSGNDDSSSSSGLQDLIDG